MPERIADPAALNALRDKARADLELRAGPKALRVTVHMGTCGIAAGARDLLGRIAEELGRAGARDVTLRHAGCAGLCDQEPMLTVADAAGNEFRYGRLDPAKVSRIVEGHLLGGTPVANLLIKA